MQSDRIRALAMYIKWHPRYLKTLDLGWVSLHFSLPRWPKGVWFWAVEHIDRYHERRAVCHE